MHVYTQGTHKLKCSCSLKGFVIILQNLHLMNKIMTECLVTVEEWIKVSTENVSSRLDFPWEQQCWRKDGTVTKILLCICMVWWNEMLWTKHWNLVLQQQEPKWVTRVLSSDQGCRIFFWVIVPKICLTECNFSSCRTSALNLDHVFLLSTIFKVITEIVYYRHN